MPERERERELHTVCLRTAPAAQSLYDAESRLETLYISNQLLASAGRRPHTHLLYLALEALQ